MTDWAGLVVADDLTGAMDTGHAFAARGHRTVVSIGDGRAEPGGVLVLDTDSRYVPPDEAAARVSHSFGGRDAEVRYKKVDSTMRGNIVAEIDAAMAATDASLGILAPAFPASDRTTACGYHLVDGELLTATPVSDDPERPVTSARLRDLVADSAYQVEHLGIETVASGPAAVRELLCGIADRHTDPVLVTCDSTHERHLAHIATGGTDIPSEPLWVGSAGLAAHVPLRSETEPPVAPDLDGTRVLGVAGSTHPRTLEAIQALADDQVVALDAGTAVTAPERAAGKAATQAAERLAARESVVVTSARSAADVEAALTAAERADVPADAARERIAAALAETVTRLYAEMSRRPDGLFLTGGAVAGAVLAALDVTAVELAGAAVAAGVPLGRTVGGAADGTPIVTKAGGFGTNTTVKTCLANLRGDA